MSGELQTIPARHGVATFVPSGRTIKIINTYGKQVVSTWAFGLHAPPEDDDDEADTKMTEEDEEEIEEKTKMLEEEFGDDEKTTQATETTKHEGDATGGESSKSQQKQSSTDDNDDPPEQAPDTPENEKTTETTQGKKPEKRTWSSYLPSIPYRNRGGAGPSAEKDSNIDPEAEKAKNAADSKKWSSYLPTGKSFSSYVPNVQLPDSKGVVSAFQSSHYRDPNKSYAEQLYDFSKTPVGAGSIAAATGSGTASSLYAAYNAYTKMNPNKSDQPPMEYLSLPHTRASSHRLVPEVNDTLLTNLRNPIMTLVEDTTTGAHDTLTAACDASLYAALGIEKPEEHGSCAVNLVLALKELNEKAGLKGTKAVGADITVNIAPTPLHLFMNAPVELERGDKNEGSGAKGSKLVVEEPKSKKRSYVKFRAERDMVIVMSACPMEVGKQNGGRCMAANFMVEEASEEDVGGSTNSIKKAKPKKIGTRKEPSKDQENAKSKSTPSTHGKPATSGNREDAERRDSAAEDAGRANTGVTSAEAKSKTGEAGKPRKKPKKLERRTGGTTTTAKNETS